MDEQLGISPGRRRIHLARALLPRIAMLGALLTGGNVALAQAPTITSDGGGDTASISVPENQTAVTTVTATAALTFSISGGADQARFGIVGATGVLTFLSAPDFETPTDAGANNTYVVDVTATGLGGTDSQTITVTVTNVNDAPPSISSNGGGPAAAISVAENQTAVTTVTATNPEGGAVTFSLSGGADQARFGIVGATGVLTFLSAPDFETPTDAGANNTYVVDVTATASGGTDSQTITVTVTNVNDAPPSITSNGGGAAAAISVAENQTAVTTVTATNPEGGAVTFSLSGGADQARFGIVGATGVLTFLSAPDFENPTDAGANNTYVVDVTATASGLTDSQTITVTVTNVSDAAPSITSNGGGPAAAISVAENQTAVTTVTASNPEGGAVTFSLSGGADQARFGIVGATGVLTFLSAPDFENPTDAGANNTYVVDVTATASGGTDSQTITVTVTNVSDAAPSITSNGGGPAAAISVAENQTAVTTVTATNPEGGAVTFSLSGGADQARFGIVGATGVLTFTAAPDFETPTDAGANNTYVVDVTATASGGTDSQTITVTVTNVNDAPPSITSNGGGPAAAISVAENQTAVTTVTATNPEGGAVTFSLSGGADQARFGIVGATGVLTFLSAPDFETPTDAGANNTYVVDVTATASGGTDSQTITVTVTNQPDAAPSITSNGGGPAAAISVAENQTAVTTVTATNPEGGAVTFSLSGGADQARFGIVGATGVLTFLSAPDFENPTDAGANNTYVVNVTATASGGTDSQTITVTVTNVSDAAPSITSNGGGPAAAISVAENQTAVTTVTASNPEGSALSFSLTGGADQARFGIVGATGVLTFLSAPDFETPTDAGANNTYVVDVTATASGLTDSQTITVTVTNVSDAAPSITSNGGGDTASISVAESQTAVTTVTASNPEGGALTFSLSGGADQGRFSISSTTGVLTFASAPDFETPTDADTNNTYVVAVTATAPSGADSQTITVTVTNVSDAAPSITSNGGGETASISVAENQTAVTTVTASNPEGGALAFSLSGGADQARFSISSTTGVLTFSSAPDFETPTDAGADNTYIVTVTVTVPSGSDSQTITVTVTSINEAPNAVTDSYNTAEDTALNVAAPGVLGNDTDADAGTALTAVLGTTTPNGTLTFNANGSFSYVPRLNFSGADSFTYHATDGTVASSVVTVTITVTGVNDSPSVTSSPQTAVAEDVTYSYTITATDPEGNPLTFAAPTLPSWLVFTAPATISGTPTQNQIGAHNVVMTVSDGIAAPVQQPFTITVTSVDDAPVIATPIADQIATELVAYSLNLATFVTDVDTPSSSLSYSATTPLPSGLTLSAAGVLSGTPALGASVGDFVIGFAVSDGPARAVPPTATFKLTVLRAGRADLAVTVAAAPNPVALSAAATWTFTIKNNAPTVGVGGVLFQAAFSGAPFQFTAPTNGCTIAPAGTTTQVSCTLGPLAGGATTTVTLGGSGNTAGDVFAAATVSIAGAVPVDETKGNDTAAGALSIAQRISAAPAQGITGLDARAAAAGDLNGDSFVDLAIATGPTQSTMVLLNIVDPSNPNKRVLSNTPIAVGGQASDNGIALADLDGDSDLDIVTATGAGAVNGIFLNSGSATFTALAVGDATENSRAVAAGDINGDLRIDLVFANGSPTTVYTNQGVAGVFARTGALGNADSRGVVLVNLLGDALPELVLANADSDASVYRNTGGAFQLELALPTGPTTSVAAADFNNDGRVDLVFGRNAGATPAAMPSDLVWLNTSGATGSFVRAAELGASATTAVAVADIDLDGDADILAINGTGGHQTYLNAGNAFTLHAQQIASPGALAAAVGRLSVDARVDAALVGPGGVAVFYNDGSGNLGGGDVGAPIIQLVGQPSVTLVVGSAYTDAGATASDAIDGNVTARIVVNNPVNPAVIGSYTVSYDVTDLSGNSAARVTRTVQVQAQQGTSGGGGGATGFEWILLLALATLLRPNVRTFGYARTRGTRSRPREEGTPCKKSPSR